MTRRLLPLLFAACAAGPIPACIAVSGPTPSPIALDDLVAKPVAKSPRPSGFATFRPGESVPKNPDLVASKPAEKTLPEPEMTTEPVSTPLVDMNLVPAAAIPSAAEAPLMAALRAHLENKPEEAIKHLSTLDRASQDLALSLMPILVRSSQMNLSAANPEEAAMMVEQLHGMAARLERKAALKVDKVAFCRKISGFGRFEPWPEGQPYKPNDLAVLYVELKNLGSEPVSGPSGETWLCRANVCLEVRDATGKLVEQTDPADWKRRVPVARFEHADHSRSPLHDYSRTYRISVPTQPGVYTVTVEVKDHSGTRVARSQPAEFRVAGP